MPRILTPALLLALPAGAAEISLQLPMDCDMESVCFIQQYMDRDPTEGAADFTCGPLSYDTHSGTDFALPDLAMQQSGVDILAAAPGRVTGLRDGMADILIDSDGAPDVTDRECGNGVVLDHGDGWVSQYCHMAQGSVSVAEGDEVAAGTVLGQVGYSGEAAFPHLHFSLRHNGAEVDPFSPDSTACGAIPAPLWATPVAYAPGGLVSVGFADQLPEFDAIKAGTADTETLTPTSPALVLWGHVFGGRTGDTLTLRIAGPNGPVFETTQTLERTQARLFRAGGRRTPPEGWVPGLYTGEVTLRRAGLIIDQGEGTVRLE